MVPCIPVFRSFCANLVPESYEMSEEGRPAPFMASPISQFFSLEGQFRIRQRQNFLNTRSLIERHSLKRADFLLDFMIRSSKFTNYIIFVVICLPRRQSRQLRRLAPVRFRPASRVQAACGKIVTSIRGTVTLYS